MRDYPEGFEIPVHRSIINPILTAGLPRTLCFLLWTMAAALGLGMQQLWIVPIAIVLHLILAAVAKNDPYFFDVVVRAIKAPKRLDP